MFGASGAFSARGPTPRFSVSCGLRVPCLGDNFMFKDLVSVLRVCPHLPGRQAEAGSVPEAEH